MTPLPHPALILPAITEPEVALGWTDERWVELEERLLLREMIDGLRGVGEDEG